LVDTLVILRWSVIKSILERIRINPRTEVVYLGIGTRDDNKYFVDYFVECSNVSENPSIEFIADPLCIYNAYIEAEKSGYEIVAILHSHPGPPNPSFKDIQGMKRWPVPWIIVDSHSLAFKAWVIIDGRVSNIKIIMLNQLEP